jgi:hypothetical protein
MGTLPAFLLRDTAVIEPYVGPGAVYGTAQTAKAHVQETRKVVRKDDGTHADATLNVFLRLGPTCPVGSKITVRGTVCTVVTVDVNDTQGLPTPDHLDVWVERCDFLPTASLDLIRGTTGRNAFHDIIASTTLIAEALPAHVIETKQARPGPENQRATVVETYTIRLRPGVDVQEGDRLIDSARGCTYVVQTVVWSPSPLADGDDVRVTARRVTPTSTA